MMTSDTQTPSWPACCVLALPHSKFSECSACGARGSVHVQQDVAAPESGDQDYFPPQVAVQAESCSDTD
jgi:hypothetical protein